MAASLGAADMPVWAWFAIAGGTGTLLGVEAWAWMRHGTSAVALVGVGLASLAAGLVVLAVVVAVGYGFFSGTTGVDPLGWNEDTGGNAESAEGTEGAIDSTPEKLDGTESYEFEQEDLDAAAGASDAVKEYCAGAVSEAQRLGCESHVNEDEIP
jgi:hypothetical protein